jgi:hypothetical protein
MGNNVNSVEGNGREFDRLALRYDREAALGATTALTSRHRMKPAASGLMR